MDKGFGETFVGCCASTTESFLGLDILLVYTFVYDYTICIDMPIHESFSLWHLEFSVLCLKFYLVPFGRNVVCHVHL